MGDAATGTVLGLPADASPFVVDLDPAGPGICNLYRLVYTGTLQVTQGSNFTANTMRASGDSATSNILQVNRNACALTAGSISRESDGATQVSYCGGDGQSDSFTVAVAGADPNAGSVAWVITDAATGTVLGLPADASPFVVDLDPAGPGICNLYRLVYTGTLQVTQGSNFTANTMRASGDSATSNILQVNRNAC